MVLFLCLEILKVGFGESDEYFKGLNFQEGDNTEYHANEIQSSNAILWRLGLEKRMERECVEHFLQFVILNQAHFKLC